MMRRALLGILALGLLIVLSAPSSAEAADIRSGPYVRIEAGEVVNDDLYLSGGTVDVNGTVNGDVVVAGGNVNIRGTVNGDLIAAGGSITVQGPIRDSIRAAGGSIAISSQVGGDIVAAGGSVELGQGASVARDLLVGTGSVRIDGTVGRDARLGGGEATINGTVRGDVLANVGNDLALGPAARIEGDLRYTSATEARIAQGATVLGTIVRERPTTSILGFQVTETPGIRALQAIISRVQWFLGTALVGLLLLWIAPRTLEGTSETVARSPWGSLGIGLGLLVLAPIAIGIAAIIAIFVGGFSGVPVLVAPLAGYLVLLALTAPVIALLLGRLLLPRLTSGRPFALWQALLLGVLVLALLGFVPVLNWIVTLLTVLFGFGAWAIFLFRNYRHARQAHAI